MKYFPRMNGLVGEVKELLKKWLVGNWGDWAAFIAAVQMSLNDKIAARHMSRPFDVRLRGFEDFWKVELVDRVANSGQGIECVKWLVGSYYAEEGEDAGRLFFCAAKKKENEAGDLTALLGKKRHQDSPFSASFSLFFGGIKKQTATMRSLLLLVLLLVVVCSATDWYVTSGATGGDGSEEAPFGDFQTAFNAASNRDTILGAPGIYPSKNNRGMVLGTNLSAVAFKSSGDGVVIDFSDNVGEGIPFLTADPLAPDSIVFGANISHFKFTGQQEGNIFSLSRGLYLITTTVFEKNLVKGGHCIESSYSSLEISNVNFTENGQGSNGPAIFSDINIGVLENVNFVNNNENVDDNDVLGGAVHLVGGDFTFRNTTFFANRGGKGGALYACEGAAVRITDSEYNSNHGAFGGAIASISAHIDVEEVDFFANSASSHGGAIYQDGESFSVLASTFVSNSAENSGGGVFVQDSEQNSRNDSGIYCYGNIERCSFLQNMADYGGGLAVGTGMFLYVSNCTFDHNENQRDDGKGPAIYVTQSSSLQFHKLFVIVKEGSTNVLGAGLYVEGGLFYEDSTVKLAFFEVLRSDHDASLYADLYFSNVSVVSRYSLSTVNLTYNASLTFCDAYQNGDFGGATLTNGNLYLQSSTKANFLTWIAGEVGSAPIDATCNRGPNGFSVYDDLYSVVQLTVGDGKIEAVPLKTLTSIKIQWVFLNSLVVNEHTQFNIINGTVVAENEMVLHSGALIGDPFGQSCNFSANHLTMYDSSVVYGSIVLNQGLDLYFSTMDDGATVKGLFQIVNKSPIITHYSDVIVPVEEGQFEVLSWEDYQGAFVNSSADFLNIGLVETYFSYSHDGFYQVYSQFPPSPPSQKKDGKVAVIVVFSVLAVICVVVGLAWFIIYRKRSVNTYSTIQGE